MMKKIAFTLSLIVIFTFLFSVISSDIFASWKNKDVARYYLENGLKKTGSPNIVSSVVWDFRAFDTLGEETVLFTAAVGIFTLMIFGPKKKKKA
ncbi:MAG: hypothetical protein J7K72_04970 [Candidatus Aenigmarchaeota archaeon]|nr:hypothetical protein [Candidatus Aenigmarchaeota archaeon]